MAIIKRISAWEWHKAQKDILINQKKLLIITKEQKPINATNKIRRE